MTDGSADGQGSMPHGDPPDPTAVLMGVYPPPPYHPAPPPPERRTPWSRLTAAVRSHRLPVEIGALVVALLAGTGVGLALDGGGTGASVPASAPVPATSPPTTAAPRVAPADGLRAVRGRITAESSSNWTVVTARGRSITVVISPSTKFGTAAAPSSAGQFAVGDTVVVRGALSSSSIVAARVLVPRTPSVPPTTGPGTTATGPGTTATGPGTTATGPTVLG